MRYEKEVLEIELAAEKPGREGYYYTTLFLPAEDYEILDALQKIRAVNREQAVDIRVLNCEKVPELQDTRLDSPTIAELNFFAKRLDSLSEEEQIVFDAVIGRLFPESSEDELLRVKDLINTTYGLDQVPIAANISGLEELGRFALENDMLEETTDIPESAFHLLDPIELGRIQKKNDGGVFVGKHYVVAGDYQRPEVYDGKTLPPEEPQPAFVFRLKIAEAPVNSAYETENSAEWICLPMDKKEADQIAQAHNEGCIEDCVYFDFESSIPQIQEEMFGDMQRFDQLNALASRILKLPPSEQVKYKAAMEAEQPENIRGALNIAGCLRQYEFSAVSEDGGQFFREYLSRYFDTRLDSGWLDELFTYRGEERLLGKLGATVTKYGVISACGCPLFEPVPHQEPYQKKRTTQAMSNEKLDVIEVLDRKALFSNGRIMPEEIPEGLYAYDLRHSDDGDRFVSIEPKVGVNHGGTVLMKEPLDFGEEEYISFTDDTSPNFLSETMTMQEFAESELSETEGMQMGGIR